MAEYKSPASRRRPSSGKFSNKGTITGRPGSAGPRKLDSISELVTGIHIGNKGTSSIALNSMSGNSDKSAPKTHPAVTSLIVQDPHNFGVTPTANSPSPKGSPGERQKYGSNPPSRESVRTQSPREESGISTEYKIECCCKQPPLILTQHSELKWLIQSSTNEYDTLKTYNLFQKINDAKEIDKKMVVGHATCKIFCHLNNIMLLSGSNEHHTSTWKPRLYQLQYDTSKGSWKQICRFPSLQVDLKNSVPVSYENDGMILSSIYQERQVFSLVIYMLSQSKTSEKSWKAIKLRLGRVKYEIQSCVVKSSNLYCNLLHETGAYIYHCDIRIFQRQKQSQCIENVSNLSSCPVKDSNMQNCFLSIHKENIFVIVCLNTDCNRTAVEIKHLDTSTLTLSQAIYWFEFSFSAKIVSASVIPDIEDLEVAIVYHSSVTNYCHINRIILKLI